MSPPTVNSAGATKKGKKKKKKTSSSKSSSTIRIKPFAKPPTLPHDFYQRTSSTLIRSTFAVLRREPLYAETVDSSSSSSSGGGGGGDDSSMKRDPMADLKLKSEDEDASMQIPSGSPKSAAGLTTTSALNRRPISREELYRSVEDLCTHSYGPQLYHAVVQAMDDAAAECVRRLLSMGESFGCHLVSLEQLQQQQLHGAENVLMEAFDDGATVVVFSKAALHSDEQGLNVATGLSGMPSSSSRVASLVDGGGKVLSRIWAMYASFAEYLGCVRSIFLHLDRMFVYHLLPDTAAHSRMIGRVIPRGAGTGMAPASSLSVASASLLSPSSQSLASVTVCHGLWDVGLHALRRHMTGRPSTSSSGDLNVMETLIRCTVSSLVRQLNGENINEPLVRNSVRMIGDLDSSDDFMAALISDMVWYFESECRDWMTNQYDASDDDIVTATKPNATALKINPIEKDYFVPVAEKRSLSLGGNAPAFLRHVETRLRQVQSMASYYLLPTSSSSSSAAAVAAAMQTAMATSVLSTTPSSPSMTNSSATATTSTTSRTRILMYIVESRLLAPHLTTSHILSTTSLYPLLDDDDRIVPDVRRLYQLSRRTDGGMDALGIAFGDYGRRRGLAIVHMGQRSRSSGTMTTSSLAAQREARQRIVPELLRYKSRLEDMHTRAFQADETFGRTLRTVLEDVLNAGGDADDDHVGKQTKNNLGTDGGKAVAELLAKHVDLRFRNTRAAAATAVSPTSNKANSSQGGKALSSSSSSSSNDQFQESILSLFRHVHSKDVFEAFYKRDLAKRLLLNRSVSTDSERQFVSRLKSECGGGYTSKMEGMFKDMDLSREVMKSYAAHLRSMGSAPASAMKRMATLPEDDRNALLDIESDESKRMMDAVDMDVQVLTTGYWPLYPQYPNIILPKVMLAHRTRFESYYKNKYQGRRLTWQYALGNCVVRAHFPKLKKSGPRELVVSVCQALVLLCFNDDSSVSEGAARTTDKNDIESPGKKRDRGLTIKDVMERTGISDRDEAERIMQSLSLGKDGTRVLLKVDHDEDDDEIDAGTDPSVAKKPKKAKKARRNVSDHDAFFFNSSFTSNQRRIRITNVQMRETQEERTKTHDTVSRDRLYFIDAAIVRILKARKSLEHRALLAEVMNQLKFPATGSDVKKRIESLIERDYVERAEGDRSRYNYLA